MCIHDDMTFKRSNVATSHSLHSSSPPCSSAHVSKSNLLYGCNEARHKGRFIKKKELTRRENVRKVNIERSKQNRDKIVDKNRAEVTLADPVERMVIE